MSENLFFWIGFSTLLVHEMDAVRLSEWRILPLLSRLNDQRGFAVFTLVHIPIYVLLLVGLSSEIAAGEKGSLMLVLDWFMVIHVGLHVLLRNLPRNEFKTVFSWLIIAGAGLAGAVDAVLYYVARP
ncbi:DUF6713 family protein [Spirosoma arcticum]